MSSYNFRNDYNNYRNTPYFFWQNRFDNNYHRPRLMNPYSNKEEKYGNQKSNYYYDRLMELRKNNLLLSKIWLLFKEGNIVDSVFKLLLFLFPLTFLFKLLFLKFSEFLSFLSKLFLIFAFMAIIFLALLVLL